MEKTKIGILVEYLQVPDISVNIFNLFNTVIDLSDKTILFLRNGRGNLSRVNPLDYETRKIMVQEDYDKQIEIHPLPDQKHHDQWCKLLDKAIDKLVAWDEEVTIYTSSIEFASNYEGSYKIEFVTNLPIDERKSRETISTLSGKSFDYRHGMIYGAYKRYPICYGTVDVAILDEHGKILLGRKPNETLFRFVGGFVDPSDLSLEAAAKRECLEEVSGIETDSYQYIGSVKVNDWRYKPEVGNVDGIMTSFFACQYIYGAPKAADDIAEVVWKTIADLNISDLVGEHGKSLIMLKEWLNKKQTEKIPF